MNSRSPLVIAVTGLNATDSPGPGIAVIRALREGLHRELRIIGLSYDALEPGIYLHQLVDKTYQIPYPTAGSEALNERIHYIHGIEHIDVLIPNFDAELYNFIRISAGLRIMGIHTFLPTLSQLETRDKLHLAAFGKQHGFDVPESRTLFRADDLRKAGDELLYPMVVKGKFYEAEVVHTLEQAQKAFYHLSAKWGTPVIAQQYVKGSELNIAVLGDGEGGVLSAVPMRKLYITDKGKAWAGITIEDEALPELARKFAAATQWRGGCELELMKDAGGKLFIMEINPRFPAWIYLAAAVGNNQPAALVQLALGEEVAASEPCPAGKLFIRYSWDEVIDVKEFQQLSAFGEL